MDSESSSNSHPSEAGDHADDLTLETPLREPQDVLVDLLMTTPLLLINCSDEPHPSTLP